MAGNRLTNAGFACAILVGMAILTAWAPVLARVFAVAPFLLFLPGFLLLRTLRPKQEISFEFVVLSVGMSIVATIVFALVLHAFNAVTAVGWGAALSILALVALLRSFLVASDWALPRRLAFEWSGAVVVGFVLVVVLLTGGIALARYGAVTHRQFTYTDLWLVPSAGDGDERVTVGVRNKEQTSSGYDLEVLVNGSLLMRWSDLYLADNDEWVQQVPISAPVEPGQRIEARLYNHAVPFKVYRDVWLSHTNAVDR